MVSIVSMNKEHLWTRDKEISYSAIPSTSCRGQMVFRDGQTKAVGICPKHMYFLMFQDLLLRDQPKVVL